MPYNPKSLGNLKLITSETARENQKKAIKSRELNREMREQFKLGAKNMQAIIAEMPSLDALGILNFAMIRALEDEDYILAASYAEKIAEYQKPKLQRIDQTNINKTYSDLSDEELEEELKKQGMSSLVKSEGLNQDESFKEVLKQSLSDPKIKEEVEAVAVIKEKLKNPPKEAEPDTF